MMRMNQAPGLPLAAERYLAQLDHESRALTDAARGQLLGQIREHLTESLEDSTDAERTLAKLGSPRELVEAAMAEGGSRPATAPPRAWVRALPWTAAAGGVTTIVGLIGITVAPIVSMRGLVLWPSLLVLALGAGALLATGVALASLRRERLRPDAAGSGPLLVASLAVASSFLGIGLLLLLTGVLLFAMTGRVRSAIVVIPGLVLVILGIVLLTGSIRAARSRRASSST